MKYKKIVISLVIIVIALIFTHKAINYNDSDDNNKQHVVINESKWLGRYPQLGAIESSAISVPITVATDSKRAELIGVITNQYGIRDDILQYILNNVPASNKQGIEAAIHLAQNEYDIYYGSDDPEKIRYSANMMGHIIRCMNVFFEEQDHTSRNIAKLYRNTPAREKRMHDIEGNILGGHVYDDNVGEMANINFSDSEQYCKSGGVYWK